MSNAAEGSPDLRLVPLAIAGWGAAWLGTWSASGPIALGGVAGVIAGMAAVIRRSWWLAALALVLVFGMTIGAAHHHRLTSGPVSKLAAEEAVVALDLLVRSDPRIYPAAGPRPAYLSVRGTVLTLEGRGRSWRVRSPVLLTVTGAQVADWSGHVVGTRLLTQARLQTPTQGSDIAAVLRVRGPTRVTSAPSAGLRLVERVRRGLRDSVGDRRPEPRALVPALVLGDSSAMTGQITDDFQVTGLTHLTAVSGANLTLLLAFMLLVARWAGVRGWWLRAVGLLGVIVFVALCRTEPSVLRAAAMGLVALAALGAGGGRKGLRTLSVAMLILLMIDPFLSRSVGFVLSVLASGGIVWWARRWAVILRAWLPGFVADAVAVPLAAHLATLPVVAGISSRVSVVGIVTNAVAGPFVGPATVLGFAAAALSLASSTAASVAGFGAAGSAQVILWVAHAGARFPGASWHWPANPWSLLVLGFASLVMGSMMGYLLTRRWLSLVLALVLVVGFLRSPVQPGWPPRNWIFVACDVGQGDGLVVRAADRQAVVIDAGPDPASIRRCLDQLGVRHVPALILTHFHADHVNGLAGVLDHRSVTEMWVSPLFSPIQEAHAVQELARARGIAVRVPALGEEAQVGEASWRVIGPRRMPTGHGTGEGESSQENDASVVLLLTVRGVRILLTGDVEPDAQQAMLASGTDLEADVLKIAHHGSGRQDPDFIAASRARVAIASAGVDNDYGHPAPRTVHLVRSLGMTLLRTDQDGSIAITSKNGELAAVTQHPR